MPQYGVRKMRAKIAERVPRGTTPECKKSPHDTQENKHTRYVDVARPLTHWRREQQVGKKNKAVQFSVKNPLGDRKNQESCNIRYHPPMRTTDGNDHSLLKRELGLRLRVEERGATEAGAGAAGTGGAGAAAGSAT